MKQITSRDNPFFKELKRLAQSGRERKKTGKALLDGTHLIRAYEEVLGPVEQLIVNEAACQQPEIAALIAGRAATVLAENLFRDIAVVETPSGIMALVPIPASPVPDFTVDSVLLDGVQDPGNVGTLLRTAAAAGFRQVLLSADCAGVWSPKVLRAGQGAHFALSLVEDSDLAAFLKTYQARPRSPSCKTPFRSLMRRYRGRWPGCSVRRGRACGRRWPLLRRSRSKFPCPVWPNR